jgi:hypothetical protein
LAIREIGIIFRDASVIKELARGLRRRLDSFGARGVCGREENASLPIGKTAKKMAKIAIIRCIRMGSIIRIHSLNRRTSETTMDENKPAAKDDSVLNAIARTVGTTAGIIVAKAAQFTEAAAQASGVSKRAKAPAQKAKSTKKRVVVQKKKAVARNRPVKVKRAAKRETGGAS